MMPVLTRGCRRKDFALSNLDGKPARIRRGGFLVSIRDQNPEAQAGLTQELSAAGDFEARKSINRGGLQNAECRLQIAE